jgi:uncharacterized protein YceK
MKLYGYFLVLLLMSGCSSTVTGPITKNKYNLEVGCTDDMRDYQRVREAVINEEIKKPKKEKIDLDCPATE